MCFDDEKDSLLTALQLSATMGADVSVIRTPDREWARKNATFEMFREKIFQLVNQITNCNTCFKVEGDS
jgi:hypothetical protein